jgi:hypothetical protein
MQEDRLRIIESQLAEVLANQVPTPINRSVSSQASDAPTSVFRQPRPPESPTLHTAYGYTSIQTNTQN